jgi:hypothetical protein
VRSIARTYYWNPFVIGKLFLDDIDKFGLFYWYNDAKEMAKEIKGK